MQDIVEFYKLLAGKIETECPGLNTVMLLYDGASWHECRHAAGVYLKESFGGEANDFILEDMQRERDGIDPSVSRAYMIPLTTESAPDQETYVFQVNINQALNRGMAVKEAAKSIIAHETSHLVSSFERYNRGTLRHPWESSQEEALADLFAAAVMASEGVPEFTRETVKWRLKKTDADCFAITSTEHSFPAVAEAAQLLAASYQSMAPGAFSLRSVINEAVRIVRNHGEEIKAWRHFANAAIYLQETRYNGPDILALAREAGSPFADTVEAYTPFRAAVQPARVPYINPFIRRNDDTPRTRIMRAVLPGAAGAGLEGGYAVMHNCRTVAAGP